MPSEYDFLMPYSRSFRRAGRAVLLTLTFAVGIACTAFVVALPLRWGGADKVATSSEKPDQSWRSQKTADAAAKSKSAEPAPPRPSAEMKPDKPAARVEKPDTRTAINTAPAPNRTPAPQSSTRGIAAPNAPTQMTESMVLGFGPPRDTNGVNGVASSNPPAMTPDPAGSSPAPVPADNNRAPDPVVAATEPVPLPRPRPHEADAAPVSALATNENAPKEINLPKAAASAGDTKLLGDTPPSARTVGNTTDGVAPAPASARSSAPAQPSPSVKEDKSAERAASSEKTAARTAEPPRREPERPLATPNRARTETQAPRQERAGATRENVTPQSEPEKPAAKIRERARIVHDSQRKERRQATRDEPRERAVRREQEPRRDQRRFARDRGDDRDVRREFVDEDGVRHIILPRNEKSRLMRDLRERTASRQGPFLFMRGPRGLFDDDED